ncbi:MAG: ABC transporter substrate-binding protein, partial [Peptococcaceae bacterium]|nr:ABC transporter substrate-binding protein [Peptococcaceae bacterium]
MRDDKTAVKKVLALGALGLALAAAILALCLRIGGGGFVGSGLEGGGSVYYQRARDTGGRIDGIVIGVEGLTGGFKPEAVAAPGDRAVSDSVYEPLVSVGPDGQPVSVLAREIGISEDGLTYTVSLREGVAFQDGQPLLAEDAVASVLACAGRQTRHERFLAGLVGYEDYVNGRANSLAGVQAAGEGTVTFTFVVPSPGNIWALGVGTQKAAEIGNGGVYNGTGPYRLAGWDHAGREARLSPNEAYRGKAPAGDITLREIDLASGAALYQAGEIDAL